MSIYNELKTDIKIYWELHGTRIIAVVSGAVASVAVLDPSILVDLLGRRGVAALALVNAIITYWRGSVNAKRL